MNCINPIHKLLDKAHRRFIRSRPGSVLILVVALLVLMALIGTAFMTMAQFDRVASVQHAFNTEVDLLVDGVINQVKGTITGDLFVNGQFRPATTATGAGTANRYNSEVFPSYGYYNGIGYLPGNSPLVLAGANPGNWWLGARLPTLSSDDTLAPSAANFPVWSFITGAINESGHFDSPYWPGGSGAPVTYPQRTTMIPSVTSSSVDGQFWPAFTGVAGYGTTPILAADADGDGIADSGLVKLLTLDGITYYAAVRVIDNNSAINASIAQTPNPFSTYNSTPANRSMPGDLSPVNLDLEGMVANPSSTYASWSAPADLYGASGSQLSPNGPGLIPNFRFNGSISPSNVAYDENGVLRNDFSYMQYRVTYPGPNAIAQNYLFDQQWMQLGRRLRNPGYLQAFQPSNPTVFYQALPISEQMTMARDFVVRSSSIQSATSSSSVLEMRMPNTVFYPAPTTSYLPGNALSWFSANFDYATNMFVSSPPQPNVKPMRALLVSQNPVSNFAPGKFTPRSSPPYQFGDMVTAANGYKCVCICPGTPPAPQLPDQYWTDPYWAWEPWTNAPTKTSVNTGTFQQLYAAYWAVMADQYTPASGATPAQWMPPFPTAGGTEARMFRNPLRSYYTPAGPTAGGLLPQQMLYVRAALAAINTMQLRSGDQTTLATNGTCDVLSRTVYIPNASGTLQYKVNVYGAEKQPYMTQIYARNDKTVADDFIAVELYNPFSVAIKIGGWKLAVVDRTTIGQLKVASLDGSPIGQTIQQLVTTPTTLTSIPPNSFVVLMSNTATPPNTIKLPSPMPANFYQCTNLTNAFGKELVLMRPHFASGMPFTEAQLNNTFDERAATNDLSLKGLYDWIPVDSYDFSNIPPSPKDPTTPQEWHYRRPDSPAKNWHFVYPGPWQVAAGAASSMNGLPTWSATVVTATPPPITDLGTIGLGAASNTPLTGPGAANYQDVAIQINNTDFGGPLKPSPTSANNSLPLGTFPRNGDILQTTFIGAYKVVDVTTPATPKLVELNAITSDSAMATSQDVSGGYKPIANASITAENIGRFCPIDVTDAGLAGVAGIDDFPHLPPGTLTSATWRYHWATRLFDFLTVQAPQDDYFPNVDPWLNDPGYPSRYRYAPASGSVANLAQPVANVNVGAANTGMVPPTTGFHGSASEDAAPVDGLVNVNTAPWRVLAAVPWVPATEANYRQLNAKIGVGIARYRDGSSSTQPHGPFLNLFELGEATISTMPGNPKLRDILLTPPASCNTHPYTLAEGNLTPLVTVAGAPPAVAGDFQALFNTVTRVSNLVTTRSDSFTAYILVQGWRNAETANPHLVVQRRAAVILDRSTVTPTNPNPSVVNVPVN